VSLSDTICDVDKFPLSIDCAVRGQVLGELVNMLNIPGLWDRVGFEFSQLANGSKIDEARILVQKVGEEMSIQSEGPTAVTGDHY